MNCTEQRRLITKELQKLETPATAETLYISVKKHLPQISLGTIYRNLELLVAQNVVRKFANGKNKARFELKNDHKFHISCPNCGEVRHISSEFADEINTLLCKIQAEHQAVEIALQIIKPCQCCTKIK